VLKTFRLILLILPALAILLPATLAAAPAVVKETPLENVPGEIIAWTDSTYIAVERKPGSGQKLFRVNRASGNTVSYQVGKGGRGVLLAMSGTGLMIARETDSAGVHVLQQATWPYVQWTPLFPVTDPDPHICWQPDGRSFLYQDILDDSLGTPSVFEYTPGAEKPRLFLVGGQRPLMSPTGDAIAVVGVDLANPGPTRDIEARQPVGLEDLDAGEFNFIAPLRTFIPTTGAWSPDGIRLALVGYATDGSGTERRVYVYSRRTGQSKRLVLPLDRERADQEHTIDAATWSPDGKWIAVGRMLAGNNSGDKGAVWFIDPDKTQVFELKPGAGRWEGTPFWIGPNTFAVIDPASRAQTAVAGPLKYWIVEVGGN
jgi:hypothetical protein